MPLNKEIKKVLLIGSGPIVIGQAAEFDYAGTQACRALMEEGIEIVLVNSNPATIMTDDVVADHIYIEPLTLPTIKRIIEKEKPDSILSGFGGQTGLTLSMQLAKEGFLEKQGVKLLGALPDTIEKAEDRQCFKDTMEKIKQPCIESKVVETLEDALKFVEKIGYPAIIRPAYTLGGSGGGIVQNEEEMREIASNGLMLSPIHQILVEKCISGWKEIEFEVIRDGAGNAITVCSMENFDPVGIHTGDSIVIAPAVTLADKEYQMLRTAALTIIHELGIEGGCNCQFALHPDSFEYAVIEVNPRVSRSSALASKATGYPIAKVAAKIAIGYRLDEIVNAVTGETYAAFEPALDYVAVKFPRWPFDKFIYAKRELGTQMKATGEVMSIADTFEAALMKAVRGVEIGQLTLRLEELRAVSIEELYQRSVKATDQRLFVVFELLCRGVSVEEIHDKTAIDPWFLYKLKKLSAYEAKISNQIVSREDYILGKQLGYTDASICKLSGQAVPYEAAEIYRMVDTCAGEFAARTPYFYGLFEPSSCLDLGNEVSNEARDYSKDSHKKRIVVLGSGPIRIGQGIEFDYANVHCVMALQKQGYEVIIINNNPETVSTDFDTGDRLYFEPLYIEDVLQIIRLEKPEGVVVAFGGQTAIKLTKKLDEAGVRIIGTSADGIDMAEDRERFEALLEKEGIFRPQGFTIMTMDEAVEAADKLGYPVLLRPSYVLGGQNMIIAYEEADIREYMSVILTTKQENPVLIDKYLSGVEVEVDAICDGHDILIPGIMEHVERTGVHSGDSIAVYPAPHIDDEISAMIYKTSLQLCRGLGAIGLMNLQYIVSNRQLFVIEVNPRASRTVPYLSKVTGVPMCDLATRVSLGERVRDLGYGIGIYPVSPYTAVKVPVFSFEKLIDVDTQLGPEMKSTGEVLGIGRSFKEALYKGIVASGCEMKKSGGVLITVRRSEKIEMIPIARKFHEMGFQLYATPGNAILMQQHHIPVTMVQKLHAGQGSEDVITTMQLLEERKVNYLISISAKGRNPARDSVKLRRKASLLGIPCITSLDTASAIADCLMSKYTLQNAEIVDINRLDTRAMKLHVVKMQSCSNDYLYINGMDQEIASPEFLSVLLSERHTGVGADGVVIIKNSSVADAKMQMFNIDGSEGMTSGNALRCVAKYLFDKKIVKEKELTIETASGINRCHIITKHGLVYQVAVQMGVAEFSADKIPVRLTMDEVIDYPYTIGDVEYRINCVSMGNPHCVVFANQIDELDLQKIGPLFERDSLFPERVNAGFAEIVNSSTIKLRVWERGNGETLACGSGACAAVVMATKLGYCEEGSTVRVLLPGGELQVQYTSQGVILIGDAEKVFEADVEI